MLFPKPTLHPFFLMDNPYIFHLYGKAFCYIFLYSTHHRIFLVFALVNSINEYVMMFKIVFTRQHVLLFSDFIYRLPKPTKPFSQGKIF